MPASAVAVRERPILMSAEMVRAILDGRKQQTRRVVKLPRSATFNNCAIQTWDAEADKLRAVAPEPPDIAPFLLGKRVQGQYLVCNLIDDGGIARVQCYYGQPGDRLWVRETHSVLDMRPEVLDSDRAPRPSQACPVCVTYQADDTTAEVLCPPDEWRESFDNDHTIWRPSIHMPRWASRIMLEITNVRVERLQAIREDDAIAEGAPEGGGYEYDTLDGAEWRGINHRAGFRELWDSLNAKRGYGWDVNPWTWVIEFARVTV